jgi:hypothetical protein
VTRSAADGLHGHIAHSIGIAYPPVGSLIDLDGHEHVVLAVFMLLQT